MGESVNQRLINHLPGALWIQEHEWAQWAMAGGVLFLCVSVLFGIQKLVFSRLRKWARETPIAWDDRLLERSEGPVRLLVFMGAFGIALQFAPPELREHVLIVHGIKLLLIGAGIWLLDRGLRTFFAYLPWAAGLSRANQGLLLLIARAVVYSVALLTVLDTLGISITPLLASLGVGSIAVALALQDTLGNLFSGLYILLDKPVREGDYVQIQEGTEGFVRRIGWRSTRIESTRQRMIIIPNSKLVSATITNFDYPSQEIIFALNLGVGYESDLAHVERVAVQVAKEVIARTNGVEAFEPLVRFTKFGDSSIDAVLVCKAKHFIEAGLITHELIKAIHKRFNDEKINIPYPQRTVHLKSETTQ